MELNIITTSDTLDNCIKSAEKYFNVSLRLIREDLSIFEQYSVRPVERIHIKNIWKYRIVVNKQLYYFGTI